MTTDPQTPRRSRSQVQLARAVEYERMLEAKGIPPAAVRVVDIDMLISSMFVFMLKWAIASIPAVIILGVVGAIVVAMLGGIRAGGSLSR